MTVVNTIVLSLRDVGYDEARVEVSEDEDFAHYELYLSATSAWPEIILTTSLRGYFSTFMEKDAGPFPTITEAALALPLFATNPIIRHRIINNLLVA